MTYGLAVFAKLPALGRSLAMVRVQSSPGGRGVSGWTFTTERDGASGWGGFAAGAAAEFPVASALSAHRPKGGGNFPSAPTVRASVFTPTERPSLSRKDAALATA